MYRMLERRYAEDGSSIEVNGQAKTAMLLTMFEDRVKQRLAQLLASPLTPDQLVCLGVLKSQYSQKYFFLSELASGRVRELSTAEQNLLDSINGAEQELLGQPWSYEDCVGAISKGFDQYYPYLVR